MAASALNHRFVTARHRFSDRLHEHANVKKKLACTRFVSWPMVAAVAVAVASTNSSKLKSVKQTKCFACRAGVGTIERESLAKDSERRKKHRRVLAGNTATAAMVRDTRSEAHIPVLSLSLAHTAFLYRLQRTI